MTKHSPAKINWFLSVTGKRNDGFHDLVSLVCPLTYGDTLTTNISSKAHSTLSIKNAPLLENDDNNLILKAEKLFQKETKLGHQFDFHLDKKIPMGAGLGGGSSNASIALLSMNELAGYPLSNGKLSQMASQLGSDCPLFLTNKPSLLRGRGEIIEEVPKGLIALLQEKQLLVWKPEFAIFTPWAYREMAEKKCYTDSHSFEKLLKRSTFTDQELLSFLFNSFEEVTFAKYLGLEQAILTLRAKGIPTLMSGSGSACFSVVRSEDEISITNLIKSWFGSQSVLAYSKVIL